MRRAEALTLFAAAGLLGLQEEARAASISGTQLIRIAGIPIDALTPLYYAQRNGALQRAGIAIELESTPNTSAATAALVGGSYEMANSGLTNVFTAHVRNVPITLIAPQAMYTRSNPLGLLQVAPDSPLRTAADLNGKIVAVQAVRSLTDLLVRAWTDKNGGDSTSIKFVEIPITSLEAAVVEHRVDAALLLEPFLSLSLERKSTKSIADVCSAIAPAFMIGGFVARTEWAKQNADLVRNFNRVLADSTTYCNTHPAQTAQMMAEVTQIPLAVIRRMHRITSATRLDVALIQPLIDAAARYQLIPQTFPAQDLFWNNAV